MHDALFYLAAATVVFLLAMTAELVLGGRKLRRMADVALPAPGELPTLSVVIAARNEERNLEEALRSVLALRWEGGAEVIVVDDRSTDATGAILDRMAATARRLRVVHVAELPAGWLGKNHALWHGAQEARGELLLFTDADVVMEPTAVQRAAAHLVRGGFDHVTAGPDVLMPGMLLRTFGVVFAVFFSLFSRPWKAADPRSRFHIGIGAFNLVRARAYREMGTHRAIAMRPDDDMKLGKLVKKHGFRQDFLIGAGMVSVEWYASLRELVNGLKKNGFAGVDYRLSMVWLATVAHTLLFVWPFVALFATHGWTRGLNAAAVAIILVVFAGAARETRVPPWYGVIFPAAVLLFLYVVWNSTLATLLGGGIEWRGTHYPLAELKANRI
ncbi:MAG TPA: glycosyltransferase family 2 protein [Longimicrobiaceae bacterium]|jgi:cellulose synthase/poly-beta-1,6-N-acetylglucosamine synthase-like glycosyltransferase|nr:glycosyltransferase family 2 protein [Longimicrobiaceae bacterium]